MAFVEELMGFCSKQDYKIEVIRLQQLNQRIHKQPDLFPEHTASYETNKDPQIEGQISPKP